MKRRHQQAGRVIATRICGLAGIVVAGYGVFLWQQYTAAVAPWTAAEVDIIETLWLDNLPPLASSTRNAVADNPRAASLGQKLFFDTRLSANGQVSCATCHQPQRRFTDGLPTA